MKEQKKPKTAFFKVKVKPKKEESTKYNYTGDSKRGDIFSERKHSVSENMKFESFVSQQNLLESRDEKEQKKSQDVPPMSLTGINPVSTEDVKKSGKVNFESIEQKSRCLIC